MPNILLVAYHDEVDERYGVGVDAEEVHTTKHVQDDHTHHHHEDNSRPHVEAKHQNSDKEDGGCKWKIGASSKSSLLPRLSISPSFYFPSPFSLTSPSLLSSPSLLPSLSPFLQLAYITHSSLCVQPYVYTIPMERPRLRAMSCLVVRYCS